MNCNKIIKKVDSIVKKLKDNPSESMKLGFPDDESLFRRNHITNGGIGYYKQQLSENSIKEITEKHRDWLIK